MNLKGKSFLVLMLFTLFIGVAGVNAAETIPFTEQAWKSAQAKNDLTLVVIHADWCPVCKTQEKILNSYFETYPQSKITRMMVNYDTQKEWVKYFKAPRQSTLYVYQGNKRLWFAVAETNKNKIFNELKRLEGIK